MAAINGLPNRTSGANAPVHDSPINGPGSAGGLLNSTKDVKKDSTQAEFGDVLKSMQAQYGAKEAKPRAVKKQMDKDDFLKIMVTQMKNQDPMSPMKADQFATQLAQFTSVEQLQNLNQKMGQMTKANQPLERLAMTSLIGKVVTVDRDRFVHADNEQSTLNYEMPANAKSVKLTILNEQGEKIGTRDLGPVKLGQRSYNWDGKKDDGMASPSGNYLFRIEARDDTGKQIPITGVTQSPVVGITFESGEGVLLVGDVKNPTKTSMKNVTRVDTMIRDDAPGAPKKSAARGPAGADGDANAVGASSNHSGSDPLAAAGVSAELQEKIRNSLAQSAGDAVNTSASGSVPAESAALSGMNVPSAAENAINYSNKVENKATEGFPNGLSSGDNG